MSAEVAPEWTVGKWLVDIWRANPIHVDDWRTYDSPARKASHVAEAPAVAGRGLAGRWVMLDLDMPAALIPSSTPGHWHLYIKAIVGDVEFAPLMDTLSVCGIIEAGYARASKARGAAHLRYPWIRKGREDEDIANGGHISPEQLEWLLAQPSEPVEVPF